MAKYICLNCGYVYDEEKGAPGVAVPNWNAMVQSPDGCGWHKKDAASSPDILPGTKWADVPAGFACPSCRGGKAFFESWA